MDANGHRFWLLASADDFALGAGAAWGDGCLRLAGAAAAFETAAPRAEALAMADLPPVTTDAHGTWAWFDPAAGEDDEAGLIVAEGAARGPATILRVPGGAAIRDLSVDGDGVLRIAGALAEDRGGLAIADIRGRWRDPYFVETPDAAPDRVAKGWLLERSSGRVWVERGVPISDLAIRARADHIFRPDPEYANPPRLEEIERIATRPAERIVDCAAHPDGTLAILVLGAAQGSASRLVFVAPDETRVSVPVPVAGFPGAVGWVAADKLALTYPDARRALVLEVTGLGSDEVALTVSAARYPIKGAGARRLTRTATLPVQIAAYDADDRPATPRPLHPISLPGYAASGTAAAADPIDSGRPGTIWHRLAIEADLPAGTWVTVAVAAADDPDALAEATLHPHHVGAAPDDGAPRAGWIAERTELPHHPGLLGADPVPGRTGCFLSLLQTGDGASRQIAGRFLRVQVTLHGRGHLSPRIAGLRFWGDRFSLVRNYLPPIFHPPVAAASGPADPQDMLDRHVAMFESWLTRIEDKTANAHLVTDPHAAPPEALEWLSAWVGLTLTSGLTEDQRRHMLANALRLNKRRGTMGALMLALELATGAYQEKDGQRRFTGEVSRGGIVALEDFRLRRVFATILGADLGTEYDPLLAGPVESGNSFVGPTLHLGDAEGVDDEGEPRLSTEQETELAALYRAPEGDADREAVRGFFARLAWRVTVLVHADMPADRFQLIEEIAERLAPAHVHLRVRRASKPLILGLYSLVGVDTYLRPRPGPTPVVVDRSILGEKDFILRLPALDPRLDHGDPS